MKQFRIIFAILTVFWSLKGQSGRPLITDDAGVVESKKLQIETWMLIDERSSQHWLVPTVGVKDILEVSASLLHGVPFTSDRAYSYAGPILQSKILVHESTTEWEPSLALSGGGIAPYGRGFFKTQTWDYFYYLASSFKTPNEKLLLHLNLGQQSRRQSNNQDHIFLWGAAVELGLTEKTFVFAEGANGDVYAFIPGIATQVGFRTNVSETLQIDGTLGRGLNGDPILPLWITFGIKLVTDI